MILQKILLSEKSVKKYLELYNVEEYLFNTVGIRAKKRGYLTFQEFYDICMWKSPRPKQKYIKNKNIVGQITKEAFFENDEEKKMSVLCKLSGVAIPTASAILTIVNPKKYGVIDIRCLEQLKFMGYDIKKIITIKNWLNYLAIMRDLSKKLGITPRQLDMVLFAMHREKLNYEGYKNLYN